MMKNSLKIILACLVLTSSLAGCNNEKQKKEEAKKELAKQKKAELDNWINDFVERGKKSNLRKEFEKYKKPL